MPFSNNAAKATNDTPSSETKSDDDVAENAGEELRPNDNDDDVGKEDGLEYGKIEQPPAGAPAVAEVQLVAAREQPRVPPAEAQALLDAAQVEADRAELDDMVAEEDAADARDLAVIEHNLEYIQKLYTNMKEIFTQSHFNITDFYKLKIKPMDLLQISNNDQYNIVYENASMVRMMNENYIESGDIDMSFKNKLRAKVIAHINRLQKLLKTTTNNKNKNININIYIKMFYNLLAIFRKRELEKAAKATKA